MSALDGVTLRPAREADLPGCEAVYRAALNAYLQPLGIADVPTETPGLRRLHAHTLATDPERFWVAARGETIIAFGSAVVRGPVWFLSMLFVEPGEQGRGFGRALLERLGVGEARRRATATDSAQPVSNALYASLGIVPRVPLLNLLGRPRGNHGLPSLPAAIGVAPLDDVDVEEVAALDRTVIGYAHPEDHAHARADTRRGYGYRDPSGRLAGYGYASESGRVGPIAALEPGLVAPILGHLLTDVEPRGASSVWLPGTAGPAVAAGLRAGLRLEPFPILLCWDEPFADFSRYVPMSPGLP